MFQYSVTRQEYGVRLDGGCRVVRLSGYVLRWTYNGKRDSSDCYGCSYHRTHRGLMVALNNRKRASLHWNHSTERDT